MLVDVHSGTRPPESAKVYAYNPAAIFMIPDDHT